MHVVVVGGGIAGLGAAWELRKQGVEVTLIDRNEDPGGRCRSFLWHDVWLHRGAFAFIKSEQNLIDLAKELGIYEEDRIVDMTEAHQERLLYKRTKVLTLKTFSWTDIRRMEGIPAREKLALARVLPKLARQRLRNDPRDLSSAAELDTVNACEYFRRYSPRFVDYVLEPSMNMFCGYGEQDYSLAWLVWVMSGFEWAHAWWSFKPRGVGQLTHSLGERLAADGGCNLRLGAVAREILCDDHGVEVSFEDAVGGGTLRADATVVAVPGNMVSALMPGLDAARRAFFDRVEYVAHHIVRYLVDTPPDEFERDLILPTADGFERVANVHFIPLGDGTTLAGGEVKGKRCVDLWEAGDDEILADAWQDFVAAVPGAGNCRIHDQHLQRNDIAICRREAGFVKRLAAFRALPPQRRVAFAGDYMINSTVGQAHYSGLQAARQLLASAG